MTHPLDKSATDLAADLAARRIGALELTEAAIARIEERDPPLNAVVVRDFDRARDAAMAADAAIARGKTGPLLGVPMTVKESNNVAGLRTTWGVELFGHWTAPTDAVAVERLKSAGAIILGKTNVPPFLADWQSDNVIYGRSQNPWNLERTPGGSSGGAAAAVASGMSPIELGSDIGGSIRVPSAFCGLYGHKPTWELVPSRGHQPPGTDSNAVPLAVVGPIARTADDLDLVLGVIAGPTEDLAKAYSLDLPKARGATLADYRVLVIDSHPIAATDNEIRGALHTLAGKLERAGVWVARESALLPDLESLHHLYGGMLNAVLSRGSPNPAPLTAHGWMDMQDGQLVTRRAFARLFEDFDVILAPTYGRTAYPHDARPQDERTHLIDNQETPYFDQLAWPGIATLANLPATAAPVGLSTDGMPIGVQIIGPAFEDRTTIHFARLMEQAFGGFRFPPGYN
ncbi:amidase family protein [Caulobacter sp. NIBR1757]|uniref:amidase family protein n=1 Tax=Caulobacter sp. NIBR1757 TaxID=3016000 RepID=UPI0022EFF57F|nr:amidase family protein [Caulobacter sp. NIBR1757]WGM39365.1 Glutamyl-tRNA(Gln) amidotransferase subunit A [Caulobacter sp. NIBR1757]